MRAYGRRHRRWSRRGQPLLLVADEPRTFAILATLGRVIYRYRSELAPVTVAAVLDLSALWLHSTNPGAWCWVLAATGATTLLTALRGAPWGALRVEERAYAAVATVVAGIWLTVATTLGPGHRPLQSVLLAAMITCGIPWWRHRRRRARVRVDRTIQAWPNLAEQIGLAGSRVLSAAVDVWGWRARMTLRAGQTVADVVAQVPAIESGLGTRPGAVRVEADPAHAGRFVMRVLAEDPHANAVPWRGPAARSVTDPVRLGVFEDATDVAVSMLRRHVLVGGIAGAGKSGVLNVIIGNLVACSDIVLWGIDLKGGMELRPWAPCLARLATTPADAEVMLRDAVGILEARARAMADSSSRLWIPTERTPALVIVVDEYAELAEQSPAAADYADSIARRGRAVAETLLAATQRPTQQAMGKGAIRSQMDVRVCLRVRERRDTDLILGQGMVAAGWHAHELDAPGKFFVSAEGFQRPRRARAYLVTDEDVRATVERYAADRPILDPVSVEAVTVGGYDEPIDEADPEAVLWAALAEAPEHGLFVPELMHLTGMRRTWIYDRLQPRATQVRRGRWRILRDESGG